MHVCAAPGSLSHLRCALEGFYRIYDFFVLFIADVKVHCQCVVDAHQLACVAAVYYRIFTGLDLSALGFLFLFRAWWGGQGCMFRSGNHNLGSGRR